MIDPTPADDNALLIAVIFEDFEIDHTPDGWPAVKQMHLSAAAIELRKQHAEIERLTAQLASERATNLQALRTAEATFRRYGLHHHAKCAYEKAIANFALADQMADAMVAAPDDSELEAERTALQNAVREAVAADRAADRTYRSTRTDPPPIGVRLNLLTNLGAHTQGVLSPVNFKDFAGWEHMARASEHGMIT